MRRLIIPDLDWLREVIDYDPLTGRMVWAVHRPPGARMGREVGSFDSHSDALVTRFQGHRYQLHHLIWYMTYGVWPAHQILFRDKDPRNLKLKNLYSVEEAYSEKPKAVAARRRRSMKAKRIALKQKAQETPAALSGYHYTYDPKLRLWGVADIVEPRRVLTRFETKQDAEAYIADRQRMAAFVQRFNLAYKARPGDDLIVAGSNPYAESYAELAELVCYNPATGEFYYRAAKNSLDNLRADFTTTTGRQVVTLFSRYFSVAMLAWFLTWREWPKPKAIGWRDGNPKNNRLANLYKVTDHARA